MVHRIYPAELQLNKANASDTEAAFLDLNLSIHNDIVSTKIYDKRDDLILILLIFRSLMAMSLNVLLMVYIYLNLFALPEHLRKLLTSIIVTNSKLPNFLSKAIGIINSAKHFPNFIVGTLNWSKNIMSVWKNLCNKVFVIQNLMEIWYINLRKSLEIQTSLIFSNV